jgi:hypothetical protein
MRIIFIIMLLALGSDAGGEQGGQTIAGLVRQLADPQWQARQQAEDELVARGAEAVEALEGLVDQPLEEEVHARVLSALARIEQDMLIGPSIIRMSFEQAHPREVFEELARQARTVVVTQPPDLWESTAWDPISLQIDGLTFWQTLEQLEALVPVYLAGGGQADALSITTASGRSSGAVTDSGAFRIVVTRLHRTAMLDMTRPEHVNRDLQLHMVMMAEPKLRVLQQMGIEVESAVDELGNSLLMPAANAPFAPGGGGRTRTARWNSVIRLSPEPTAATRLARLKATARVVLQTRAEQLEIPDALSAGQGTHVLGGHSVTIREIRGTENQVELRVTIPRRDGAGGAWPNVQQLGQSVELLDARGRPLPRSGGGTSTTPQQWEFRWNFQRQVAPGEPPEEPLRLVFEIPTESVEVSVPFEFQDLPLP